MIRSIMGWWPLAAAGFGAFAMACDVAEQDGARVVYSSLRTEDERGVVGRAETEGALSKETEERAARPYRHLDRETILDEEAWARSTSQGGAEYGYRLLETDNPTPVQKLPALGRPKLVDPRGTLEKSADPELIDALLEVRNLPEWDVPLRPVAANMSAEDYVEAVADRRAALLEREALARDLFADVEAQVAALGGKVRARGRYSNWISVRISAGAARELAEREDLKSIVAEEGRPEEHSFPLGETRADSLMNADQFLAAGYTGEAANSARHAYGDIVVGVIEPGVIEDEACFLRDGATCATASRLVGKYRCSDVDSDGNFCESVADFPDDELSATHGTAVASTVLADYRQGQGDAYALGDGSWTAEAGHSETWENRASGVAPEASLVFFGDCSGYSGFADAYDDAVDLAIDITNSSWGYDTTAGICNLEATTAIDLEAENAFDDGILNVASAGNPNSPSDVTVSCNTRTPADLVKVLSVNAFDVDDCDTDYNDCTLDLEYSATGGIDAEVNGVIYPGVVSSVDLLAPNNISHVTYPNGDYGSVGSFVGTSAASPIVAGAAALVKDWQLSAGNSWINSPGRLHTLMLAMGDRHRATWKQAVTSQGSSGTDRLYGLGRLKMRLFQSGEGLGSWYYHMRTTSFTSGSADHVYMPFTDPIPAGTAMVKCVLMQDEDMSEKDDISKIDLELRLRSPVGGACSGNGALQFTRIDASRDTKKMVAIEDSHATLENRCLEVTLEKEHVTSAGITTHALCYYAGIDDDGSQ